MKPPRFLTHTPLRFGIICALSLWGSTGFAGTLYWDANGNLPGAGETPNGTWGTDNYWTTSEQGTLVPSGYQSGSDVVFAAGADSNGSFTVAVSGTQSARSLFFRAPGAITLSGGTLQLGGGGLSVQANGAIISSALALTANQTWNVENGMTFTQRGNISGAYSITKTGSGTLLIDGAGLGNIKGLVVEAGGVKVTGNAIFAHSANVTLANAAGVVLDFSEATGAKGLASLSGGGSLGGNVNISNLLYFYGAAGSEATYAGVISGASGLVVAGAGTQGLTGLNTFTGSISIFANGTIVFDSIADAGTNASASALGAPRTAASGKITLGRTTDSTSGTLKYIGEGHSSNRAIDLASTTGTGRIDASGTGALVLTGGVTASGAGSKILNLTGSYKGNNTIGGVISDNSLINKTHVQKTGAGKWILGANNTYTGETLVDEGTLFINGSTTAESVVRVARGATLGGSGLIKGDVLVNGTLLAGDELGLLKVGKLNLLSTSSFQVALGRDGDIARNAQLAASGIISIADGADLHLSLSPDLNQVAIGDTFFLLLNESGAAVNGVFFSLNGTATDLSDGQTFFWNSLEWMITYHADQALNSMSGGDSIAVQVIPEPNFQVLGLGGLLIFGALLGHKSRHHNKKA